MRESLQLWNRSARAPPARWLRREEGPSDRSMRQAIMADMRNRFLFVNAAGTEVEVSSELALADHIARGELTEDTLLYDSSTREWAPLRVHPVGSALLYQISSDEEDEAPVRAESGDRAEGESPETGGDGAAPDAEAAGAEGGEGGADEPPVSGDDDFLGIELVPEEESEHHNVLQHFMESREREVAEELRLKGAAEADLQLVDSKQDSVKPIGGPEVPAASAAPPVAPQEAPPEPDTDVAPLDLTPPPVARPTPTPTATPTTPAPVQRRPGAGSPTASAGAGALPDRPMRTGPAASRSPQSSRAPSRSAAPERSPSAGAPWIWKAAAGLVVVAAVGFGVTTFLSGSGPGPDLEAVSEEPTLPVPEGPFAAEGALSLFSTEAMDQMGAALLELRASQDVDNPPAPWLSGAYLADAGAFSEVEQYWERYATFVGQVREREDELFRAGVSARLEAEGTVGSALEIRVSRLLQDFRFDAGRRDAEYSEMEALASTALELHRFLATNARSIVHLPAEPGPASADGEVDIQSERVRGELARLLDTLLSRLDRVSGPDADRRRTLNRHVLGTSGPAPSPVRASVEASGETADPSADPSAGDTTTAAPPDSADAEPGAGPADTATLGVTPDTAGIRARSTLPDTAGLAYPG